MILVLLFSWHFYPRDNLKRILGGSNSSVTARFLHPIMMDVCPQQHQLIPSRWPKSKVESMNASRSFAECEFSTTHVNPNHLLTGSMNIFQLLSARRQSVMVISDD